MKLSNIKYIMIAMLVAFASCSKEENEPAVSVDGDIVNFGSLSTIADDSYKNADSDSKVEYGNLVGSKWELKWNNGDKVKITRHGATAQSVDYIVTPNSDPKTGTLAVDGTAEALRWSSTTSEDVFSVVYPTSAIVGIPSNYKVELQYEMYNSFEAVIGGEAAVNMSNFRMLNFQSVKRDNNAVNLTSVPATTTLDITIKGPSTDYLPVSRIAIVIDNSKQYISKDGKVSFIYNKNTKAIEYGTYSDAPREISFVYTITNNSGYIDLSSGQYIKFKAFIPGIPYSPGAYKVRVNYGVDGKLYTPKIDLPKNVKHPLSITATKGDDSGWIGDLPDDMKVIDMSIPGSFMSTSYLFTSGGVQPCAQLIGIADQWKHGIRVFHVPCDYEWDVFSKYWIVSAGRGSTGVFKNSEVLTEELFDRVITLLDKQQREFAIIINPYCKSKIYSSTNHGYFKDGYDEFIKKYVNSHSDKFYTATLNNNIKIEDLRGKILLIHESRDASLGPVLSDWYHYDSQTTTPFTYTIGGQTCSVASVDEGYRAVLTTDQCKTLVDNNFKKSGSVWTITDVASHTPNRVYSDYLTGSTTNMPTLIASVQFWPKVGMVLMPFVGKRKLWGSNTGGEERDVWGDVMSQMIINKNFKK